MAGGNSGWVFRLDGSTTAIKLLSSPDMDVAIPSSVFFPSLAATLDVTQIGPRTFLSKEITRTIIGYDDQITGCPSIRE
jgi:hypothetical protein